MRDLDELRTRASNLGAWWASHSALISNNPGQCPLSLTLPTFPKCIISLANSPNVLPPIPWSHSAMTRQLEITRLAAINTAAATREILLLLLEKYCRDYWSTTPVAIVNIPTTYPPLFIALRALGILRS